MKDSNWLHAFRRTVTSQHGEDGIIEKIFETLPPGDKWCVEFGAWDGNYLSNTWNLIKSKGWYSIQIESNSDYFKVMEKNFLNDPVFCVNEKVEVEPPHRLVDILSRYPIPISFDFLSIDVDSYDYQIWQGFHGHRPRVVCIEFCQAFKNEEKYIHGQGQVYKGSSLASVVELGKQKGYELIAVAGVNAFFVWLGSYPLFEIGSNEVVNYRQYIAPGDR